MKKLTRKKAVRRYGYDALRCHCGTIHRRSSVEKVETVGSTATYFPHRAWRDVLQENIDEGLVHRRR